MLKILLALEGKLLVKLKTRKEKKRFIKRILIVAFIQILILGVFLLAFQGTRSVSSEEIQYKNIIVDDTYTIYIHRSKEFGIISDSISYRFSNQIDLKELKEIACIGTQMSIGYVEQYGLFGKIHRIVDARTKTKVLYSLEEYNKIHQQARILTAIVFFVIELLFLIIVTFYYVVFIR